MKWLLALAAACGGQSPPVPCDVTFSGNFAESSESAAACPTLADGQLEATLGSRTLGEPISIVIADVGIGTTTSDGATSWSALGAASIGNGTCVYAAGDQAVPHGSFSLVLVADDPEPHGTLDVMQHVQATSGTDCGSGAEELIHVAF